MPTAKPKFFTLSALFSSHALGPHFLGCPEAPLSPYLCLSCPFCSASCNLWWEFFEFLKPTPSHFPNLYSKFLLHVTQHLAPWHWKHITLFSNVRGPCSAFTLSYLELLHIFFFLPCIAEIIVFPSLPTPFLISSWDSSSGDWETIFFFF